MLPEQDILKELEEGQYGGATPKQSPLASLMEAIVGTIVGLIVSMALNYIILPRYGFTPTLWANFQITSWFTLASVVRSYWVRRVFNSPKFQNAWKSIFITLFNPGKLL